ncbi:MAG TPA: NUDIX domain-containing protein [Pyrinomonadaceae bacterium]|nr:NUDIX domain-containing protein [Pyrinomonadaceae bacterium]
MKEFGEKIKGARYFVRPGSYGVFIKAYCVGVIKSDVFGKYFLVGGGINKGETEIEALRREAREEIGFEIEILTKIGAAADYFYAALDQKYIAKVCHFYRIELAGKIEGTVCERLVWMTGDELENMYHESHRWIAARELRL